MAVKMDEAYGRQRRDESVTANGTLHGQLAICSGRLTLAVSGAGARSAEGTHKRSLWASA